MEPLSSTVVPRETSKPRPTDPPRHQKFLSPFRQMTTSLERLLAFIRTTSLARLCGPYLRHAPKGRSARSCETQDDLRQRVEIG
jgi:hypothetical protein